MPDLAFYWQMGAAETDVSQYHYTRGKFVPVDAQPATCGGEEPKQGVCDTSSSETWTWSIAPAEYDALKTNLPAGSQQTFFDQAHALDFPLVNDTLARVVGLGACTPDSNCNLSIYGCKLTYPGANSLNPGSVEANLPACQYWPMLRDVSGWGVANVSDLSSDPFSARIAFVVATRISAGEVQLTRYSMRTEATGPVSGTTLVRDACQIVKPKAGKWPQKWESETLVARPCQN